MINSKIIQIFCLDWLSADDSSFNLFEINLCSLSIVIYMYEKSNQVYFFLH